VRTESEKWRDHQFEDAQQRRDAQFDEAQEWDEARFHASKAYKLLLVDLQESRVESAIKAHWKVLDAVATSQETSFD